MKVTKELKEYINYNVQERIREFNRNQNNKGKAIEKDLRAALTKYITSSDIKSMLTDIKKSYINFTLSESLICKIQDNMITEVINIIRCRDDFYPHQVGPWDENNIATKIICQLQYEDVTMAELDEKIQTIDLSQFCT